MSPKAVTHPSRWQEAGPGGAARYRATGGPFWRTLEVATGGSVAAMRACLNWQEAYDAGAAVCGGKGYNLARLARYGFRVPRGFVLSAGAPVSEIRQGLEPE